MEELKAKRDDLSRRVTREEEDRRQQRLAEISCDRGNTTSTIIVGQEQCSKEHGNISRKIELVLWVYDIWEKVDLIEIGVPFPAPENRCKVVFTTRSQEYVRMRVEDPMEVQCLAENEAFDLFQKKVGQRTLGSDPEIPELAKELLENVVAFHWRSMS
ncbi:unnamed protein product [Microthlaspi erraticum]|uniref:NB-ARC domain-containing protein n=1 Tax=Microthlaspi erraticum TaxID=1685480 RepID=A0A6D2J2W1_9BRAS|nr:unnamed protein product [Microthlaspi erraticum]